MVDSRPSNSRDDVCEGNRLRSGSDFFATRLTRARPLVHNNIDSGDDDDYDDYDCSSDDGGTYTTGRPRGLGGFTPRRLPQSGSSTWIDAQGNINELWYGIGDRLHHAVHRNGLITRPMGEEPTFVPSPVRNNRSRRFGLNGREPGNFVLGHWVLEDPFLGPSRRSTVSSHGRNGNADSHGDDFAAQFPFHGSFAAVIEAALMPDGGGIRAIIARGVAGFFQRHTQPITDGDANQSTNTECPVCLEPPAQGHDCVQITSIPGCSHLIGRECLEEFLTHSAHSKKECPLCRTQWVATAGIWEMSGNWRQLARASDDSLRGCPYRAEYEASPLDRLAGPRNPSTAGPRFPRDNLHRHRGNQRSGSSESDSPSAGRVRRVRPSDSLRESLNL